MTFDVWHIDLLCIVNHFRNAQTSPYEPKGFLKIIISIDNNILIMLIFITMIRFVLGGKKRIIR